MPFPKNVRNLLSLAALSSLVLANPHQKACNVRSSVPATTPFADLDIPDYEVLPTAISNCGPSVITITTTEIVTITVTATTGSETTLPDVPEASSTELSSEITSSYETPLPNVPEAPSAVPSSESILGYETPLSNVPEAPSAVSSSDITPSYETPVSSASSLLAVPTSTLDTNTRSKSGKATFYGGNTAGGACSFTGYELPVGISGTAFPGAAWENGVHCGSCVLVDGPQGKIKVMVTDNCPECEATHLDLYQDAFGTIGNPIDGVIPISYEAVPCGITSPLTVRTKSGCSKYWFSMQVVNSNIAVSSLEVSTDGGNSWQETTRREYNYFERSIL
ncbi:hypothetical protein EG327_000401 [Venturia inaequalis]|uniref:Expansin-like EG45 domain-containing protein n=1 Tax=Venturia inaequalis TaxID=5025 RepID=A0A8H3U9Q2_VENIN|nr:hypothetical protein EG327_000401 [Venturia inaequalis]